MVSGMEEIFFDEEDGRKEVQKFLAKILNSRNSPAFKGGVALANAYIASDATSAGVLRQLAISELENAGKTICYDPIFHESREKIFARAIIEITEMVLTAAGLAALYDLSGEITGDDESSDEEALGGGEVGPEESSI